jgi:hypothetical protein
MAILATMPNLPGHSACRKKMLRRVISPSCWLPILASSAVQATDMPDYRQVCRDGTPLPFMTVARVGKARDMVST